jgi:polysaccharide export outer membrane protein
MLGMLLIAVAAAEDATAPYLVGPGDVLSIEVFGEPDLTRQIEVSPSGAITAPLLGPVQVAGSDTETIAAKLMGAYQDGYLNQPQIAVRVTTFKSQAVVVAGTKKPGTYYLSQPTSLLGLLGEAGWVDADRTSGHIIVRRATGEDLTASLEDVLSGVVDPVIQAGDAVRVEEGQLVWLGGEVTKEGAVVWTNGLTVSEALIRSGGPTEMAKLRGAYVLRDDEKIPVNLKRIKDGRSPDLAMQPDDRLYVPVSPF